MTNRPSTAARVAGLILTGTGAAHFLTPDTFESLLRPVFPLNTRWHVYVNGVKETLLGLGIVASRTRRVALVAVVVHVIRLARNATRRGRTRVGLDVDRHDGDRFDEEGLVEVYPIEEFSPSSEDPAPAPQGVVPGMDAAAPTRRESLR